jgi:dTDP-glucose pyrophosphorylase
MSNASLKAVILAAGKGTRMKQLTDNVPKPMLAVAGQPVLEHIVRGLAGCGIRQVCIVTGYQAGAIEQYFGNGSQFGLHIAYVHQATQDGTGKAPELARPFLGDSHFILTYGDILINPENYPRLASAYATSSAAGLLSVIRGEDLSKGAAVMLDDNSNVLDLIEKPPPGTVASPWYNAGVYVFSPRLFEYTARLQKSARGEFELTDAILNMIADGHRVVGFRLTGYWIDVRDPEMLAKAETMLRDHN